MIHRALYSKEVWRPVTLLIFVMPALFGCGVQFFYNNLDTFLDSAMQNYLEMTPQQEALFEREFESLWRWHRQEELPRYAMEMEEWAQSVDVDVTAADIDQAQTTMQGWWQRIEERGRPAAKTFLKRLEDDQIAQIASGFEKANRKWERRASRRSTEDRQEMWRKNLARMIERFTGALSNRQKGLLARASSEYRPESELWGQYRLRWQAAFLQLLRTRHDKAVFSAQFDAVFGPQQDFYGERLFAAEKHNEALSKRVLLEVLASLSAEQVARLKARLGKHAADLRELSEL